MFISGVYCDFRCLLVFGYLCVDLYVVVCVVRCVTGCVGLPRYENAVLFTC